MKRAMRIIPVMLALCALLSGCGVSFDAEENTVYIDKKGRVYSVDVETVSESYYDGNEMEEEIRATVADYNEENGKNAVKVLDLVIEDGVGRLKMQYASAEDYTKLIGTELYDGSIVKALAAGYNFDVDFYRVENGQITGSAGKQDVLNEDDLKVAVIRANLNVRIDGSIVFVSSGNVTLTGSDTVSIRDEEGVSEEANDITYIVYK